MTDTDRDRSETTTKTDESTASTSPVSEAGTTGEPTPDDSRSDGGTADALATESVKEAETDDSSGRNLVRFVEWAAFAILCLLALVATFRFYFAASEAIRIWFSRDFVPIFQAVFNLLVLIASAIGISVLVRRLR